MRKTWFKAISWLLVFALLLTQGSFAYADPGTAENSPDSLEVNQESYPPPPVNLQAVFENDSVLLSWDEAIGDLKAYKIYRDGIEIGESATNSFADPNLTAGEYQYMVRSAAADDNLSQPSESVTIKITEQTAEPVTEPIEDPEIPEISQPSQQDEPQPSTIPNAPDNLLISEQTEESLTLAWSASPKDGEVLSYEIYRDDIKLGTTQEMTYIDQGLTPGIAYVYYVKSCDPDGNLSEPSNIVTRAVTKRLPPQNVTASAVTATTVRLNWEAVLENGESVSYAVYRNAELVGNTAEMEYFDQGLLPLTTYSYTVKTTDQQGNASDASNELNITTGRLSIRKNRLAAGENHSLFIKDDGTLWAWGDNKYGQLGTGQTQNESRMSKVSGLTDIAAVAASTNYSLAVKSDGSVWAWGKNEYGQLGTTDNEYSRIPVSVPGLTEIIAVSAGYTHALAVKADGTVYRWGQGLNSAAPVRIESLRGITDAAAAYSLDAALADDGTVWVWKPGIFQPIQKPELIGVVKLISLNGYYIIAVKADGSLWILTNEIEPLPAELTETIGAIDQVCGGNVHLLFLDSNGSVWSVGDNTYGQLGTSTGSMDYAVQIPNLSEVTAIAAGGYHSLALTADGSIWSWGANKSGQLGDGSTVDRGSPFNITANDEIPPTAPTNLRITSKSESAVSMKWEESYDYTGVIGYEIYRDGELRGTTESTAYTDQNIAAGVKHEYYIIAYDAAGNRSLKSNQLVLDDIPPLPPGNLRTNDVRATLVKLIWEAGSDDYEIAGYEVYRNGQPIAVTTALELEYTDHGLQPLSAYSYSVKSIDRGGNRSESSQAINVTTTDLEIRANSLAAGGDHSMVIKSDQSLWVWGGNQYGQLGDGSNIDRLEPTLNSRIDQTFSVVGGNDFSIALRNDGSVWNWGENNSYQLGNGSRTASNNPQQVRGLTGVVNTCAGNYHSLAVLEDGTVYGWGVNWNGQLGSDDNQYCKTPILIQGLADCTAVSAGYSHSLALKSDGTVWAWGANSYGQLGSGDTQNSTFPIQVQGLTNIVEIGSGLYHNVAVRNDGTVWTWGYNRYGQLGNGENEDSNVPVQVHGLSSIVSVKAGNYFSLALREDGTVWAWGDNNTGQLGTGDCNSSSLPEKVNITAAVSTISAGKYHCLAMDLDENLWAWGDNSSGQLGNGTHNDALKPVQVQGDKKAPSSPEKLIVNATATSASLRWEVSYDEVGVAGYEVYRNDIKIGVAASSSYQDDNLKPDESYVYYVKAFDASGNLSDASGSAVRDYLPPEAPSNLKVMGQTLSSITLEWEAASDNVAVVGYVIYRNGEEIQAVDNLTFTDSELMPGQTFKYYVKAIDAGENLSAVSNEASAQTDVDQNPPDAPRYLEITGGAETYIELSWSEPIDNNHIKSYQIFKNDELIMESDSKQATISVFQNGDIFTVKAVDLSGNISTASLPLVFEDSHGNNAESATEISLSAVVEGKLDYSGDVDYFCFKSAAAGEYVVQKTGAGLLYAQVKLFDKDGKLLAEDASRESGEVRLIAATLKQEQTYYLAIRYYVALYDYSFKVYSNNGQVPSAPSDLTATENTLTSVSLSWTASTDDEGVMGYQIYLNDNQVGETTSTTYTVSGLLPGRKYTLKVKSFDVAGNLSPECKLEVTTLPDQEPPSIPGQLQLSKQGREVKLDWEPSVDNYSLRGYIIYRNDQEHARVFVSYYDATNYTDSNLADGTYSYYVCAWDEAGNVSGPSATVTVSASADTTAPTTPEGLVISNRSGNFVTLKWNAAQDDVGVSGYNLYRNNISIGFTSQLTFIDTAFDHNGFNTYTVCAKDAEGNLSLPSSPVILEFTPPSIPQNLSVHTQTDTSVTISWTAAEDNVSVAGYEVYRDERKAGITPDPIYTDSGLQFDHSYSYTVKAYDSAGNFSGLSSPLLVKTSQDQQPPSIPTQLALAGTTGKSVTIRWTASTDNIRVDKYEIYRDGQLSGSTRSTMYTDAELVSGTSYTYTVRAIDTIGNASELSQALTATPQMPEIIEASPVEGTLLGGEQVQALVITCKNSGDNGARLKIEYTLDGNQWSSKGTQVRGPFVQDVSTVRFDGSWDLRPLSSGSYTLRFTLTDSSGSISRLSRHYSLDRTAPTPPGNLAAVAISTGGGINLKWEPSPEADTACYRLYRSEAADGIFARLCEIRGSTTNTFIDQNVQADITYYYRLTAADLFDQESIPSLTAEAKAVADNRAPLVLTLLPRYGSRIGQQAAITVSAEDNISLASIKLQYSIDSGANWIDIASQDTIGKAIFEWNTGDLQGAVDVRAIAFDLAGNSSDGSPIVNYIIDKQGPGKITGLTAKAYASSVILRWKDAPEDDFDHFQVEKKDSLDGEYKPVSAEDSYLGMSISGLKPSTDYWFRVAAYDKAGNRGEPSDELKVKTTADVDSPVIIDLYPAAGYYSGSIHLGAAALDNVGIKEVIFQYSQDRQEWENIGRFVPPFPDFAVAEYDWDVSALPEGTYYMRALAVDTAGNSNAADATFVEMRIDNSPPAQAPEAVLVTPAAGYLKISWQDVADTGLAGYRVYRSTEENGSYEKLADIQAIGYIDRTVKASRVYYYRIAAYDRTGREGPQSIPVAGQLLEDSEAPKILSIYPAVGAVLPANPQIRILAEDNYCLSSLTLEYRPLNQANNWHLIGTQEAEGSSAVISFIWTSTGLPDGDYVLRATAADCGGRNTVSPEYTFTLKGAGLAAPVLSAAAGGWKVELNWAVTDEGAAGYRLYRSTVSGQDYKLIKTTAEASYIDAPLSPNQDYYYVVDAVDRQGNIGRSNEVMARPENIDPYMPTAEAGEDQISEIGMTVLLDASLSLDNDQIAGYEWDLGDGNIAAGEWVSHSYKEEGTYTVTLTVCDPSGNRATDTCTVTVLAKGQLLPLEILVVDSETGSPLPKASVVVEGPARGDNQEGLRCKLYTGDDGYIHTTAEIGPCKIYAYLKDYMPQEVSIMIEEDQPNAVAVRLSKGQLVQGEIKAKRLELDEIRSKGIDVTAPENQYVYEYVIDMWFDKPVHLWLNGYGDQLWYDGPDPWLLGLAWWCMPYLSHPDVAPTFVIMKVPGEASWLKEFFDVSVNITNMAQPQFMLNDSSVSLQIPEGLSLAGTREPQKLDVELGTIAGGESREVNWVIRGDKTGEYHLAADFRGSLQPFNDSIYYQFKTKEPIKIWGGKAMHMEVMASQYANKGQPYVIMVRFNNVSDHPVYNLSNELKSGKNYTIADGSKSKYSIEKLEPGQSVTWVYRVIPNFTGILSEELSWVALVGGEYIPSTFSVIPSSVGSYQDERGKCPKEGDPVDPASGALIAGKQLLTLQGGQTLDLNIKYNSQLLELGSLGKGWDHEYSTHLQPIGEDMLLVYWNANQWNVFLQEQENSYACYDSALRFDRLVKNPDGSYTLNRQDQSEYTFNAQGQMTSRKNRYGQALEFSQQEKQLIAVTDTLSGKQLHFQYNDQNLLVNVSDSAGRQVNFTYDPDSNLIGINNNGQNSSLAYDPQGQLLQEIDPSGQTVFTNSYDSQGRVVSQTDTQGGITTFTYEDSQEDNQDEDQEDNYVDQRITVVTNRMGESKTYTCDNQNRMLAMQDALGNNTRYEYDENGNCSSITDARGLTTRCRYDEHDNLVAVTDPEGNQGTMSYDEKNNLLSITSVMGDTIHYSYNPDNTINSKTDPQGNITRYGYDQQGMLTQVTQPGGGSTRYTYQNGLPQTWTDPTGRTISYAYDEAGRLKVVTDPAGKTTSMEYDPLGNLLSQTDPLGHTTRYSYDSNGQKTSMTDPGGNTSYYQYDGNLNLISVKDTLGNTTRFTYDSEDRPASVIDPRGNTTRYSYDPAGRLVTTTNALGHTTRMYYDPVGNLNTIEDALGQPVLTLQYNYLNQISKVTNALGHTISNQYDPLGRLTQTTDARGNSSSYNYDSLNRLISAKQAGEASASQQYDADGNVTAITDAIGNTTRFSYDAAGRLLSQTSASGANLSYTYNQAGRLATTTNARGQSASYQYDDAGRLITVTDPAGTVTYSYDVRGNVTSITDPAGSIQYVYDALDRVSQYTDIYGSHIQYQYDAADNLTTLTYPDGKQVHYSYDACNQLSSVSDWAGRTTSYNYDPNGRLIKTSRPDGSVESRSYDAAGQLSQVTDLDKDGNTIQQYDYQYDPAGNITNEQSATSTVPYKSPDKTMTYGPDNRLISYNGQNIQYDADGNMTLGPLQGQISSFQYDCRNRLVSAGTTSYTYDAQNQRTAIKQNGQETRYTISPGYLSQVLIRAGPDGQKTWYIYGLGLIGQENPDGSYQSYHYDYRGSTTAITNQNGEITDRFQYAAYGQLSYREGTTDTPFLYNGRDGVMSDANGLYYMRARYYSPEILRFINQDILFGSIASPQSLNRYAYVNGQPVNYVDPFGLCREESKNDPFLDNLQNALDLMGMIPVAGEIFDAINAIIYLLRGDYGNAVLALLALIPVLGIVATGGKIALKTVIPKLITWLTGKLNDVPVIGGRILAEIKPALQKLQRIARDERGSIQLPQGKIHGHHSFPKYLGGHPKQNLSNIIEWSHRELHSDLRNFEGGWLNPKKGNTGAQIIEKYGQQRVIEGLKRFYSQDKYKYLLDDFMDSVKYTEAN